ncbi:hypothetical protein [Rhizobium acaciae]|uniref:hypothetical protein n=1 Tax=Rhizobium acaciae TaxID=2989736 RepID=UPI00221EE104|nr:hypothetical protein [Rhizobium acaciae]MCW1751114.1 hypothetical protein [Rhizobium acaciae]
MRQYKSIVADLKEMANLAWFQGFLIALLAVWAAPASSFAQETSNRAGELKTWREQCNDPDPDLRLAYVEQAVATGDVAVQRICVRLALDSDNADIRNLGLRAAFAATSRLSFSVDMPPELEAALKAAGSNEKKQAEIARWYVMQDYQVLKNGLYIEIDGAVVSAGISTWYPLVGLNQRDDRFRGQASVNGSRVNWVGSALLSKQACSIDVQLDAGAVLKGKLQCSDLPAFPISAKLL